MSGPGFSSSKSSSQANTTTTTNTTTSNSNNVYSNSNNVGLEGVDLSNFLATVSNISTNTSTELGAVASVLAANQGGGLVSYSGPDASGGDNLFGNLSTTEKIALLAGGAGLLAFIVTNKR